MTNDEIAARLLVLEEFAVAGVIGHATMMFMATSAEDAIEYLSQIRLGALNALLKLPAEARPHGIELVDDLLSRVSEALGRLPRPPKLGG